MTNIRQSIKAPQQHLKIPARKKNVVLMEIRLPNRTLRTTQRSSTRALPVHRVVRVCEGDRVSRSSTPGGSLGIINSGTCSRPTTDQECCSWIQSTVVVFSFLFFSDIINFPVPCLLRVCCVLLPQSQCSSFPFSLFILPLVSSLCTKYPAPYSCGLISSPFSINLTKTATYHYFPFCFAPMFARCAGSFQSPAYRGRTIDLSVCHPRLRYLILKLPSRENKFLTNERKYVANRLWFDWQEEDT